MQCNVIRERIQEWFDVPSAAMPADVRVHVKECADCRDFIKRWNAIEVGLVSIRDGSSQTPELSAAFASSLQSRLNDPRPRFRLQFSLPPLAWRMTVVGAAILLLAFVVRTAITRGVHWNGPAIAIHRQNHDPAAAQPRELTPDVNLATHTP
jgi:hypothetical protein